MSEPVQAALQTFLGGMNGKIDPRLLQPNTYAFGLNLTSRGGLPRTRPPFINTRRSVATGKFQGAFTYRRNDADRIVYVIDGYVYGLNLETNATTQHGLLLSPTVDRVHFVKAERYCIIQDGDKSTSYDDANWPVILDGNARIDQTDPSSSYYQANDYDRVPKGGPMAYGHGRLFVATDYVLESVSEGWVDKGRVGFMAGDIRLPHRPESILEFTETWSLASGGRFDLPEELGFIYHMDFQQNLMDSVGIVPMIVMADNGASAFMVGPNRSLWAPQSGGDEGVNFSYILFQDEGTNSDHAFVHNNSDLIFRSNRGFRTLAQVMQERRGSNLANQPISGEVSVVTDQDTIASLPKISAAKHNNRIFFTSVPDTTGFKALVSLDVDAISSITAPAAPIYDGIWTGFEWLHVLEARWEGVERLFAFIIASDGSQWLYYLDEDSYLDDGATATTPFTAGANTAIKTRFYTPYQFFETPFSLKQIKWANLWFSEVKGTVTFTVYYRTDGYPRWTAMASGTVQSDPDASNMRYSKIRFSAQDQTICDPHFKELLNTGYGIQFCIEWTGTAKCDMMQFVADLRDVETRHIACELDGTKDTIEADATTVVLDDYDYSVNVKESDWT